MLCSITPARPRLFGQQALPITVDQRPGLLRNGEDLVVENGEVVVRSIRAYRVEHLEQRRPSRRIVRRRRRSGEEPSVVDDEAVLRVARSDRGELSKERTLVVCTHRHAGAPVTIEEIERRQVGIGKLRQPVGGMAKQDLHAREVSKRGDGLAMQLWRALDCHNRGKDSRQPASCDPKVRACLDCALEAELSP